MIKLALFDFDGVFTDGTVTFINEQIIKKYSVIDGMGIKALKEKNIITCVVTGYTKNSSTEHICKHLGIDYLYEECSNKVETIEILMKKLDLTYNEVSFMGDDINDLELLKLVNISGCPRNANENIKPICKFVSKHNGGNGAIREFCDYLLKEKTNVSALICVKYFSKRFPKKNFVKFGNKTLLNNKIDTLLSLHFIDEIVINTENDEIIELVNKHYTNKKIRTVKRDNKYSLETTESKDFCRNVAESCLFDNILYAPITCPLIKKNTFKKMFDNFCDDKNDSVVIVSDGTKGPGHKNEKHNYCFGACFVEKNTMINDGDTIGNNYYIQECERIEKIDIDYYNDYRRALYYYYNDNEKYNENILQHLNSPLYDPINPDKKYKNVKIVDCTVRDGGFVNDWNYKYSDVLKMIEIAGNIGIDYYELGYLMNEELLNDKPNLWRNCSFSTINKIRNEIDVKCKLSVMIDHWRYDFNKLPDKKTTGIDLIRICNYIENIDGCFKTCKELKKKGYEVSINIIACSYLTNFELIKIKSYMISETYIDWYYFADSFGSMTPQKIEDIFLFFKNDPRTANINIGFHSHNNCQIALANTIKAIECGANMIDGTYSGEGRGGGNLPLENIVLYLKIKNKYDLNVENMLDFLGEFYNSRRIDPYIIRETLAGLLNVHPYRLKKFDDISKLSVLYKELEMLPASKKNDYKL